MKLLIPAAIQHAAELADKLFPSLHPITRTFDQVVLIIGRVDLGYELTQLHAFSRQAVSGNGKIVGDLTVSGEENKDVCRDGMYTWHGDEFVVNNSSGE